MPLTAPTETSSPAKQTTEGAGGLLATVFGMWKLGGLFALKTGGSMFLYIFLYAQIFGWWYAVGVVFSILIHELGHCAAFRYFGAKITALNFVPFMGAYASAENLSPHAYVRAMVGLAGPVAGFIAALVALLIYIFTNTPVLLAVAYFGFFINLLNLVPIAILDGAKVALAIPPVAWMIGLALCIGLEFSPGQFNMALLGVIVLGAINLTQQLRGRQSRYQECSLGQQIGVSALFFALVLIMSWSSNATYNSLQILTPEIMGD